MYCGKCNIDFSEGLRYCKWCGDALEDRPRVTSELHTCPSCAAAVKPNWTFCKSCGMKLGSTAPTIEAKAVVSQRPSDDTSPSTSLIVSCTNCGERVDSNSMYCKACGSPVYSAPIPFGASSLLCGKCNSYSPLGSSHCRVCGTSFAAPVTPSSDLSARTAPDTRNDSSTLPDLAERLPEAARPDQKKDTAGMGSKSSSAPTLPDGKTVAFGAVDQTGQQKHDPFFFGESDKKSSAEDKPTNVIQTYTANIESETVTIDSGARDVERRAKGGDETIIMASIPGPVKESAAETTILDRGRTTGPVESGTEVLSENKETIISEVPPSESSAPPRHTQESTARFGGSSVRPKGQGQPFTEDTRTFIMGTEAIQPLPPPAPLPEEEPLLPPTGSLEEDVRFNEPHTAPFGLGPPPGMAELEADSQKPQPHTEAEAPLTDAARRAFGIPEGQMPQQTWNQPAAPTIAPHMQAATDLPVPQKSGNVVTIVSIAVGAVVVLAAVFVLWWYFAGGAKPQPTPQEPQATAPPAPAQPETKPSAVPEGMVLVPGGAYSIGRDDGTDLEKPRHTVELAPFYIDTTEVTNGAYMLFVDAKKRTPPSSWKDGTYPQDQSNYPVTGISWQDAADYAAWAGKRLPTEAEWEAAARGRDGLIYPWGNEWKKGLANIGTKGITDVGRYKEGASPFGALDLIGNVWEWTADEFQVYPGSITPMPELDRSKTFRVIRGGAFDGDKRHDACYRGYSDASLNNLTKTGFRCAKDAK
jgi:formylglycine-generating enzyme required for sulfatase activity